MKTKVPHQNKARSFRPWPEAQQLFAFAEAQKHNVSELINEVVVKHLRRHIEHKVHAQQKALAQLAPGRVAKPTKLIKSRR